MVLTKIWLIPIAYGICAISATATKYLFVSLLQKNPTFLPFINHKNASLFGECVFAHLVTYSAFLLILVIYLRHRQTVEYYAHRLKWENSLWRTASTIIAGIGVLTAICVTIIAHCEDPELASIHDMADTIAFSTGLAYAWAQALLTFSLIPRMCTLPVCLFRFLIVILETATFVFYRIAKTAPAQTYPDWSLEASLWTISVCFHVFIITFFIELRFSYLHSPKVVFVRSAENQNDNYENLFENDE